MEQMVYACLPACICIWSKNWARQAKRTLAVEEEEEAGGRRKRIVFGFCADMGIFCAAQPSSSFLQKATQTKQGRKDKNSSFKMT